MDIGADSFSGAASVLEWPFAQFAVTQQFSRFRSEADIQRTALTEPSKRCGGHGVGRGERGASGGRLWGKLGGSWPAPRTSAVRPCVFTARRVPNPAPRSASGPTDP